MKNTPTPLERMSRTVWATCSTNSFGASANSRCASSKKKTSFGLSRSPASGSVSNSSARSHIRNVENSLGRSWTAASSRQLMTPRPSGAVRMSESMVTSGSPKNASASCCVSSTSLRSRTPAVADERPPMVLSSALPSSLIR